MQPRFLVLWLVFGVFSANAQLAAPAARQREHPLLMTTPAGVELARQRVRAEAWAQEALHRITGTADALATEPLPVFDRDWWKQASQRRWQDIYPEIHRHAGGGVGGPVRRTPDAAIAYVLTREPRYAQMVTKILLHYAQYEFVARHPDVGMNWAGWGMAGLRAYDLIYDAVSPQDRRIIDGFFARCFAAVLANDEDWLRENYGGRFNNHFAHHKLFIGTYGLFYGHPEYVESALNGPEGFRELIENASRDDGLWFEASLNYHLVGVLPIAEFASQLAHARHSFDLWNHPFANGRRLRDFFVAPIATLFPDGTLPTIGDTYGRRISLKSNPDYFEAFDAFPDPRLGWLLQGAERPATALFLRRLPEGTYPAPAMKTQMWPEHGYVALRSQEGTAYWQGEGFAAFVSFDRNGIHSHRDKFDLMVFGRRAHLALDPEAQASAPHAFSSRVQGELNRETVCHNTLLVDGRSHRSITRQLAVSDFRDEADLKMITVSDPDSLVYPEVKLRRTVAVTPGYVLDVFQATSAGDHTYDYLFHSCDDTGRFELTADFAPIELGDRPPWSWLKNARQARLDTPWAVVAHQGNLAARLSVAAAPGTRAILCDFPANDTFTPPAIPMLMARRSGRTATFVTVLQAERANLPEVTIAVAVENKTLRVTVKCGGSSRDYVVERLPAP